MSSEQLEPPPYPTAKECFANGYPRQGVMLWKNESKRVAEAQARKALDEELLWAGLRGLEKGARQADQTSGCIEVIGRALERVPAGRRSEAVGHIYPAWLKLRRTGDREALAPALEGVVRWLARHGEAAHIQALLLWTREKGPEAPAVDMELAAIAREPIPSNGFADSPQMKLLASRLQQAQDAEALALAEQLGWEADAPAAGRQAVQLVRECLELEIRSSADQTDWAAAVALYDRVSKGGLKAVPLLEQTCGPRMPGLPARRIWESWGRKDGAVKPAAMLAATAQTPGAADFWEVVISRLRERDLGRSAEKYASLGELAAVYEGQFKIRGYACKFWLEVADGEVPEQGDNAPPSFPALEKAWKCAADDGQRMETLRRQAQGRMQIQAFEQARQLLNQGLNQIGDVAARDEVRLLLAKVDAESAQYAANMAQAKHRENNSRLQGRLAHLQDQRELAMKRQRPAAEVAALEEAIRKVEADLGKEAR